MSLTTIHLLRHGEVHNPGKVLYGRLSGFGLSERGAEMATAVAQFLSTPPAYDIVAVVASPLRRAQQTAAPLAKAFNVPVRTDRRLIEAGSRFEGEPVVPATFLSPSHLRDYRNPFRPTWGEPYLRQVVRMNAAIETARVEALGHHAVLVSHQLPIWITRCALEGRRLAHLPWQRTCTLASLTSLTFDGTRLVGIGYAEPAAHLLP